MAADAKYYIRNDEVPSDQLETRLKAIRAAEGDAIAYVRADKIIPYGNVMDTLGRVSRSGYTRISLLSQPKPEGAKNP